MCRCFVVIMLGSCNFNYFPFCVKWLQHLPAGTLRKVTTVPSSPRLGPLVSSSQHSYNAHFTVIHSLCGQGNRFWNRTEEVPGTCWAFSQWTKRWNERRFPGYQLALRQATSVYSPVLFSLLEGGGRELWTVAQACYLPAAPSAQLSFFF